jgi:hypothetical protein
MMKRKKIRLSPEERERRSKWAKENLLPLTIKATGKKGFGATKKALETKPEITDAKKLAGYLKSQAKKQDLLSPKHPYVGRRKKRKK